MLIFITIIIVLDLVALYLIYNRIDGMAQLSFLADFVGRKTIFEFVIALVVVMLYLVCTIPINIKHLFKK